MSTKETKKSCLLISMKINKEPLEKWRAYTERNEKESLSDSLIKRTTAYINRCYSQPDLILSKLADEIHVTAPYLSNLFKEEMGETFTEYLLSLRMEKAKMFLSTTQLKTYEIVSETGYSNSYYFSSLFKKHTGMTPTGYRKKLLRK